MHRRLFLLSSLAFGVAGPTFAQSGPAEGEFIGMAGDQPVALEKQTARIKQKLKAMGYGGADVFYELQGSASSVRFKAGETPSFLVRAAGPVDPATRFGLFRLTVDRNTRRLTTAKVNPFGYGSRNTKGQAAVAFKAVGAGQDLYRLDPEEPLTPGEYALGIAPKIGVNHWGFGGAGGTNQPVFAFGVD